MYFCNYTNIHLNRMATRKRGWLSFLSGFTRKTNRKVHPINSVTVSETYKAAGTVFTDGKLILGGYQPHKKFPMISGIGGSKTTGETPPYTALRETLEELFDFKTVSTDLIDDILEFVPASHTEKHGSYIYFVYSFQDLEKILRLVKKHHLKSSLYKEFPDTVWKLVSNRSVDPSAEISHLCILPLVSERLKFDANYLDDMPSINALYKPLAGKVLG
jgi:hypothetical protein